MIWKPSPKAIQAAVEAYMSDKGIKAVLEAAINVDRPIVDLSAIRTGRSRQPAIAEERAFEALKAGIFRAQTQPLKGRALKWPARTR